MAMDEPSPVGEGQVPVIRIGRGATAMGTDAPIGTVHQIIMDQRTGELQALVIATDETHLLELPATHVVRSTGSTVYLDVGRADLSLHPDLATPYNPDQYVPVRQNPFLAPSEAGRGARFSERPVVTTIEHDAVGVVVPQPSTHQADITASMTTPETETYIPEPQPVPPASLLSAHMSPSEPTVPETQTETPVQEHGPYPPSSLTPTAPLIERDDLQREPGETDAAGESAEQQALSDVQVDTATTGIARSGATEAGELPSVQAADTSAADTGVVAEEDLDVTAPALAAVPIVTPEEDLAVSDARDAGEYGPDATSYGAVDSGNGLENAADGLESETNDLAGKAEEDAAMEGFVPPVDPMNRGEASDMMHDDVHKVAQVFDESQESYTRSAPPDVEPRAWRDEGLVYRTGDYMPNRMSWVPAAALGAVIAGIAVWSTVRAIRRGQRKAGEAAQNARLTAESLRSSMRDSVRDAGKSAVELAQTVRASAQEMAASPRDTASDALSKISDIPARYRWFRRGVRVGARAARLRRN